MMGITSKKSMPAHSAHTLFLYLCEITNDMKMTTTENIRKELQALALDIRLLDENDQEIDERNIEDEERRFPRSIEKEDVNEEKEVVTDAMKSEELVETEESESL